MAKGLGAMDTPASSSCCHRGRAECPVASTTRLAAKCSPSVIKAHSQVKADFVTAVLKTFPPTSQLQHLCTYRAGTWAVSDAPPF